jgi:chromosome segregation ATPase
LDPEDDYEAPPVSMATGEPATAKHGGNVANDGAPIDAAREAASEQEREDVVPQASQQPAPAVAHAESASTEQLAKAPTAGSGALTATENERKVATENPAVDDTFKPTFERVFERYNALKKENTDLRLSLKQRESESQDWARKSDELAAAKKAFGEEVEAKNARIEQIQKETNEEIRKLEARLREETMKREATEKALQSERERVKFWGDKFENILSLNV